MNEVIVKIAKEFKNATNNVKQFEGFLIGDVVADLPEIKVQIDPAIVLDKTNLIFAAHVLPDYVRDYELYDITDVELVNRRTEGKIKWTDKLKTGDKLILVPSSNDNMYIVIDKAVSL